MLTPKLPVARVQVNGTDAGTVALRSGRHTYQLDIGPAIAIAGGQLDGDRVVIALSGEASWQLTMVDFVAGAGAGDD